MYLGWLRINCTYMIGSVSVITAAITTRSNHSSIHIVDCGSCNKMLKLIRDLKQRIPCPLHRYPIDRRKCCSPCEAPFERVNRIFRWIMPFDRFCISRLSKFAIRRVVGIRVLVFRDIFDRYRSRCSRPAMLIPVRLAWNRDAVSIKTYLDKEILWSK